MIRLQRILKGMGIQAELVRRSVGIPSYRWRMILNGQYEAHEDERERVERYVMAMGYVDEVADLWDRDPFPVRGPQHGRPRKTPPVLVPSAEETQTQQSAQQEIHMLTTRESLLQEDLTFYELAEDPFEDGLGLDLWMGPTQRNVFNRLNRAVRNREILAVVGEVGSGKSTILRRWMKQMGEDPKYKLVIPATLSRKELDEGAITHAICKGLAPSDRIPSNREARTLRVRELLSASEAAGVTPVLLIEEAHALPLEAFITLKDLWDRSDLYRLLAIVMVGQGASEIEAKTNLNASQRDLALKLRDVRIRELFQRTRMIKVDRMGEKEIASYLKWRFEQVKGDVSKVFDTTAFTAFAELRTCGYPLTLTNVAVLAMQTARRMGDKKVARGHIALIGRS